MYERIRALREDKDLTQREMGQILMCSQRIYSNYERGDVDIPTAVLIRLADFHGYACAQHRIPAATGRTAGRGDRHAGRLFAAAVDQQSPASSRCGMTEALC